MAGLPSPHPARLGPSPPGGARYSALGGGGAGCGASGVPNQCGVAPYCCGVQAVLFVQACFIFALSTGLLTILCPFYIYTDNNMADPSCQDVVIEIESYVEPGEPAYTPIELRNIEIRSHRRKESLERKRRQRATALIVAMGPWILTPGHRTPEEDEQVQKLYKVYTRLKSDPGISNAGLTLACRANYLIGWYSLNIIEWFQYSELSDELLEALENLIGEFLEWEDDTQRKRHRRAGLCQFCVRKRAECLADKEGHEQIKASRELEGYWLKAWIMDNLSACREWKTEHVKLQQAYDKDSEDWRQMVGVLKLIDEYVPTWKDEQSVIEVRARGGKGIPGYTAVPGYTDADFKADLLEWRFLREQIMNNEEERPSIVKSRDEAWARVEESRALLEKHEFVIEECTIQEYNVMK